MAKVYPTKIDLFLAAEYLRQETGGKITIIGAYAGGHILLPTALTFPAHLPLGVLFGFYTGEGQFDTRLRVSDQSGQHGPDLPTGRVTKARDFAMQIMVNFGIFELGSVGRYRVDAFLDDRVYTEYLTFGLSDQPLN
jgi:hypothetical protein